MEYILNKQGWVSAPINTVRTCKWHETSWKISVNEFNLINLLITPTYSDKLGKSNGWQNILEDNVVEVRLKSTDDAE